MGNNMSTEYTTGPGGKEGYSPVFFTVSCLS